MISKGSFKKTKYQNQKSQKEKQLIYEQENHLSLLYKAILSVCMYVRELFAPTGHSFQDTDIWIILFDPKY